MSTSTRYNSLFSLLETHSERGFAVGVGFLRGNPHVSKFTYAPEFLRRYEQDELAKHDHTLSLGLRQDGIVHWSDLEKKLGPSKSFEAAVGFGMVDGICWATTVNGFKSIASVSLTVPAKEAEVPLDEIMEALQLATIAASEEIMRAQLSVKAREYLRLVVQGHSTAEMAEQLGITVAGVRKRQVALQAELGASNLPHAVALALDPGSSALYQFV